MLKRIISLLAALAVATALSGGPLAAQAPAQTQGIKRIPLQTHDIPGTNLEAVQGIAEIGPHISFPAHTHPGIEISYVLRGSYTLEVTGEPKRTLKAGQVSYIPADTPHWERAGPRGAKIFATWIVEKGKPLASPAK